LQVRRVRCEASGVMVPKDKAIKRFIVRNIVDASAIRDIQDSSVFDGEQQTLGRRVLRGCDLWLVTRSSVC
jgi:ribosomal protein S26